MRLTWTSVMAAGLLAVSATPARAQNEFQWRGRLSSGQTIEIKNINGAISASSSSSGDVEVVATKTARRSNPADVRIEVVPGSKGMTICAVYPSVPGKEPNVCAPGDEGHMNTQNNDTQVHFEVRIPAGVNFVPSHWTTPRSVPTQSFGPTSASRALILVSGRPFATALTFPPE